MTDTSRSLRQQRARLAEQMRRAGKDWVEIAEDFRRRYRVNARVALRMAHGWSQREVADRWTARWPDAPKTSKNISYWEVWPSSTGHEPSLAVLDRLAQLYECGIPDLLADLADYRADRQAHHPAGDRANSGPFAGFLDISWDEPSPAGLPWLGRSGEVQGDAMERRRLLQWAATGLGSGAFGLSSESVRQLLDLALTSAQEPRTPEEWEITCADHLYAIRTRPPAQVRDDLAMDLLAVRQQIDAASPGREAIELHRVAAMLAMLQANALTRLGEHGPAIRWWRTARTAADATTDRDLRVLVRAEEAGFGLYGQRDPDTVLVLTEQARRIAGPRPSVGSAKIASTQAKALSLLGRHEEARRALNTLVTLSEADLRATGPTFWTRDQVDFTASWVHAGSGDEPAGDRARDHLTTSALDYQYRVNTQLHGALCTVVNGGVDQGVQRAAGVLDALPVTFRNTMIAETGRMVLRAVPLEQHTRPAVTDLRGMLALPVPRS
ncbi:MAG: hypothetical protein HYR62_06830 [Actinobacteria bacterium]|nr:hypothetical protein [Actinomycetota bacterium]MBI3688298.1 hypothetical protein [Actinomycetota bacterium]